jgi:hypothetical protein
MSYAVPEGMYSEQSLAFTLFRENYFIIISFIIIAVVHMAVVVVAISVLSAPRHYFNFLKCKNKCSSKQGNTHTRVKHPITVMCAAP